MHVSRFLAPETGLADRVAKVGRNANALAAVPTPDGQTLLRWVEFYLEAGRALGELLSRADEVIGADSQEECRRAVRGPWLQASSSREGLQRDIPLKKKEILCLAVGIPTGRIQVGRRVFAFGAQTSPNINHTNFTATWEG